MIRLVSLSIGLGLLSAFAWAQNAMPAVPQTADSNPPVSPPDDTSQGVVMCTQEAKQSPDGSYVSRSGPRCEFAACPTTPSQK